MKNLPRLNSKGQEAAPFEVLVAVVIMGFVLFMAVQAIDTLYKEQSKQKLLDEMTGLKQALQDAYHSNSSTVVFAPALNFKNPKELRFKAITSQAICSALCGKVYPECLIFTFRSDEYNKDLCIENISPYVNFPTFSPCPSRNGFGLVDFKSPNTSGEPIIPPGTYSLVNVALGSGTVPTFCAYVRQAS